jgi:twitching motility protein PilT
MTQEINKAGRPRLGELLVAYEIITPSMLENALKRQSQTGSQIGSTLIEMGYITTDALLEFLGKQLGVPSVNLLKLDISPEILKTLPLEKIKEFKAIPKDYLAIQDIEFKLGKRLFPVVVPSAQMEVAIKSLEATGVINIKNPVLESNMWEMSEGIPSDIKTLLKYLVNADVSDLQLTAGVPPSLKMGSELKRLNLPPLMPEHMNTYAQSLLSEELKKKFDSANDLDFAFTEKDLGRFRVNIYKQRNSVSLIIRRIPDHVPGLTELGLPDELENYVLKRQGLILVTGPASHGKSTTLASLVDIINTKRRCNIITLEDPIEYLHKHKNSNVNQREIGADTGSFHAGLKRIFRQGPDVIVIGEMRDPESFQIALQAAETGHLVMSTLHARNATSTVERVIDIFPPYQQNQIRNQLADSLLLVLSQRLVVKKDGSGLVLATERLINSLKIKNFIRDAKTHQIRSQMQVPGEEYSSLDVSLANLFITGQITLEEGARHADDPAFYQNMTKSNRMGRS